MVIFPSILSSPGKSETVSRDTMNVGTCHLMCTAVQVIDATWEPDEPPPPHRRSVPLAFDQVKAQLPPHRSWEPQWVKRASWRGYDKVWVDDMSSFDKLDRWDLPYQENEDYDEDASVETQDGCEPYWLEVFGPALTRLTANQAVNMLQVRRASEISPLFQLAVCS